MTQTTRLLAPLAIVVSIFAAMSAAPMAAPARTAQQAAGRLLVDGTYAQVSTIAHREGWRLIRCNAELGYCVVERPAGSAGSRPMPSDVRAEPERVYSIPEPSRLAIAPEAICTLRQYQHRLLDTGQAWTKTRGAGMRIAVVDTGVGPHPDVPVTLGANFLRNDNDPGYTDPHGHGTHVAGTAAGRPNAGECAAGIAYESEILAARALDSGGSGLTSWVADAIVWAADNGADVINLSLGGFESSAVLQRALQYAVGRGAVPVCAAGNSNNSALQYPAAYPECLAVAATDADDRLSSFTTWGSWVFIGSPGVNIYAPRAGTSGYMMMSGTSMAAPVVSGVMALVMALGAPGPTARVLVQLGTDPIDYTGDSRRLATGAGRVSAWKAVAPITAPGPSPTPIILPTRTNTPVPVTPTRTPTRTATPRPTSTALAPGESCVTLLYIGQEPVTLRARYIVRSCQP